MMRGAHRFFWGYGPSGYDILFREGEGRALEAACLEEINRWKLAFDRKAQAVTPVHAGGRPVALLAFRSQVSTRAAGDKIRETACAVIAWESATEPATHECLLELVPPFPRTGNTAGPASASPASPAGTGSPVPGALPVWAADAWARLLNDDAVLTMDEATSSMAEALQVISLLPPAVARQVVLGEGLLSGARPRGRGLYVASKDAAPSARVEAPAAGNLVPASSPARQLDGLARAWFEREVAPLASSGDGTAHEFWSRCTTDAQVDVSSFDVNHLMRAMMSDVAHDWLLSGTRPATAKSLATWLDAGLAAGVSPEPGRLARLIETAPPEARGQAVDRLPQLASKLAAPESDLAAVMVAAALDDALARLSGHEVVEGAWFTTQTWIGSVLAGTHVTPHAIAFSNAAWSLMGEVLSLWAAQTPDALERALARPTRDAKDGEAGWLRRAARRMVRRRTIGELLQETARRRAPEAALVSERLLPHRLRTAQGRNALRPRASALEDFFAAAVLAAAKVGRKVPSAITAVAPLLPPPPAPSA